MFISMMRTRGKGIALALLLLAVFACNLPSGQAGEQLATGVPPEIATSVAQTAQAILQGTQAATAVAAAPTDTAVPQAPTEAPTSAPSDTPVPSVPATPTWTPSPTPLPCNWAQFVADVTYPDGTAVEAGTTFVKTWRLKNVGSCAWTTGYTLIFDHGDRMGAPVDVDFPHTVAPGDTVDLSVELTAPGTAGTYKGHFRLRSDTGEVFGIGADHLGAFWVEVQVMAPSPTPPPTSATMTVTLNRNAANSGTIYQDYSDTIGGTVLAGDTVSDLQARGYLTYDLSSIHGTVLEAHLNLTCSQMRNPLTDLQGIWLAQVEFALPLRPLHYDLPGTAITLLTAPLPATVDVTAQVQADLAAGDPYFQVRMHPKALDDDGQADYLQCTNTTLTITYQP
ncbi:MAG TPA: hypothetical protein G4O04_05675 [Anaerolineae bacterium]|nr:hypothetical protein [Anaerolineae bacterium]HID84988.1 hypothetical protein [Anaerolineales bacterium]HIQ09400.1 hypothetical protein [Anaerolineaceae bacterium]